MELNDKLINYLDLSTFQENILNDASVSEKATWTSLKINSEIQVLVNDISTLQWTCIDDISTLKNSVDASLALKADKSELEDYATLNDVSSYATEEYVDTAIAGVGGDAIEDVSVLPDAGENKNKLFRLDNGEKDVYVAKLLSSETITTNRLPDEQQIDKAYLYESESDFYYYKGAFKLVCTDGEIDGYLWENRLFTIDNAIDTSISSSEFDIDFSEEWTLSGNTATTEIYSVSDITSYMEANDLSGLGITEVITATYNAPEANQIGNATLDEVRNEITFIYDGSTATIAIDGEQITGYKWLSEDVPGGYLLTNKQASNIYYYYDEDNDVIYSDVKCYLWVNGAATETSFNFPFIPQLNAPDSEQVDNAYIEYLVRETVNYYYTGELATIGNFTGYKWEKTDKSNFIITVGVNAENLYSESGYTSKFKILDNSTGDEIEEYVSAFYYPVKYQRTEGTEVWNWEKVITSNDVSTLLNDVSTLQARITAIESQLS